MGVCNHTVAIPLLSLFLYLVRWGRTRKCLLSSSKPRYFTSGQSALRTLSKGEIDWGGALANDNAGVLRPGQLGNKPHIEQKGQMLARSLFQNKYRPWKHGLSIFLNWAVFSKRQRCIFLRKMLNYSLTFVLKS